VGVSGPDGELLRDKHGKPFTLPMCPRPPSTPPGSVVIPDDPNCRVEKNWRGVPGVGCEDGDCGFDVNKQDELVEVCEAPTPRRSTQAAKPESWTMSPDSFGPVTTDMTEAAIVGTGAFRVAPSSCSFGRLDWHTQKYEAVGDIVHPDGSTETAYGQVGPGLPSITLDGHGRPQYIDAGTRTKTDTGIGSGDSLRKLKAAYPGRLFHEPYMGFPDEDNYGVSGKRSHLVFYLMKDKVMAFYLTPGALPKGEKFYADMRGVAC
jgi:hypothetical protein